MELLHIKFPGRVPKIASPLTKMTALSPKFRAKFVCDDAVFVRVYGTVTGELVEEANQSWERLSMSPTL